MQTLIADAAPRGLAGFSEFMRGLQEPRTPFISPARLSEQMGMSLSSLSSSLGLHRNTLRNTSSEAVQGRLREVLRVLSAASEVTGDVDRAIFWYLNEPIADYGHKTAHRLVAEGQAEAVVAYLSDLENGATG
jgi:uncharacterized protein (DUF2384 family)